MDRIPGVSGVSLLIAALLLGVVACAGTKESPIDAEKQAFADFRAEIESAIADPDRAAQVVALANELEQDFFDARDNMQTRITAFRELNADYDATRAEIDAQLEQVRSQIRSNLETLTGSHRELLDMLTADEYAAVQKAKSKAMSAAIKYLESS